MGGRLSSRSTENLKLIVCWVTPLAGYSWRKTELVFFPFPVYFNEDLGFLDVKLPGRKAAKDLCQLCIVLIKWELLWCRCRKNESDNTILEMPLYLKMLSEWKNHLTVPDCVSSVTVSSRINGFLLTVKVKVVMKIMVLCAQRPERRSSRLFPYSVITWEQKENHTLGNTGVASL